MISEFSRAENHNRISALRQDHDELRAELSRATMDPSPIGEVAKRLAALCLPHFAQEEKTVFPVFELLPDVIEGDAPPAVLLLVSRFIARHNDLDRAHKSIISEVEALLGAANQEHNWEFANFAYQLRVHERIENEVIFPTVNLIGNYVRERLGI